MTKQDYDEKVTVGSVVQITKAFRHNLSMCFGIVSRTWETCAEIKIPVPSIYEADEREEVITKTIRIEHFEHIGGAVLMPEWVQRIVDEIETTKQKNNELR